MKPRLLTGARTDVYEGRHPDGIRSFLVRPAYHPDPMLAACSDRRIFWTGIVGFAIIVAIVALVFLAKG